MGAEPGIGVLIDKDRIRSEKADERNNPYFIQLDDGRVYGSSPAQAVKLAARDDTRRVKKGGPGVAIMIDKSRIASNNPSKRDNPYFIPMNNGRVYSSSPDEVMMVAADPKRSIFSKNRTALERMGAAASTTRRVLGKGAVAIGKGAVAAGKAIGKGATAAGKGAVAAGKAIGKGAAAAGTAIGKGAAATGKAISSGFTSLKAKLAAYSQKKTPAAKKELDAATKAAAAEVGPEEAAKLKAAVNDLETNPGANAAKTAAVVREAELTAKPKQSGMTAAEAIASAKGRGTPSRGNLALQGTIRRGGGRTKKRKLQKRARVSSKRH